ncbi:HemK/PrmC family methyltransferase [Peredibacter starrii]|uniref:peptide chain release factor N(5)-glutamine methyltransferase n=1 Tax=Peredibacter starrii TaxID=28202 RepID=A0AAX4HN49_9BACT|nr:HemK/PrmC family methyltransferase [Peredibacter starrii]WPU64602.1 HemK/PrmC family methyltransferase [Peredibacter starrii]
MREVQDILKHRLTHPKLALDQASCSVSVKTTKELENDFLKGIPFAYLLEKAEFYENVFYVNSRVLIPRPETEEFVDILVREKKSYSNVLDVGTGSGVILLSLLLKNVALTGLGVDLSPDALKVAQTNARRLRLLDRCEFLKSDRLKEVHESFELIVSNPPYIKSKSHRDLVHQQVDMHEPHMALFLDDQNYNAWFTTFFTQVRDHLLPGGVFMMEGHELELEAQAKILKELSFQEVIVIKDFGGSNRFLRGKKA